MFFFQDSWSLYFYSLYMVEPAHLPHPSGYIIPEVDFKVYHVNGGLFKLVPTEQFKGLSANGGMIYLNLVIQYWSVSKSDILPSWYVAAANLTPVDIDSTICENCEFVGDFTQPEQYKRYEEDLYQPYSAQDRYDRYKYTSESKAKILVPTPYKMVTDSTGTVFLSNMWKIRCLAYEIECNYLSEYFNLEMENKTAKSLDKVIVIKNGEVNLNTSLYKQEAYHLLIKSDEIEIVSSTDVGAFYGIQSLISLAESSNNSIPFVEVTDAPRYQYRGMHLDVARNFVQKNDVIQLLKVMAKYKLNNFHFHLTDDEGWRIPMNWCPELTAVGGRRAHDLEEKSSIIPQFGSGSTILSSGSGYYTKEDYREILLEAERHHIRVIPEVDLPGHAHAAIKANLAHFNRLRRDGKEAFDDLIVDLEDRSEYLSTQMFTDNAVNPCIEGTYKFIKNVVYDLIELHRGYQNLTIFHLGGDEVAESWTNSSKCNDLLNTIGNLSSRDLDLMEYFVKNASQSVSEVSNNSLHLGFWEDGIIGKDEVLYEKKDFPSEVIAFVWQNIWEWGVANRAYKLANSDYKVVLSPATHLYFDQPYEPDPNERGLYWASRFTDTKKTFSFMPDYIYANSDVKRSGEPYLEKDLCNSMNCTQLEKPQNILGIQGQLWSETVRTREHLHYMIFPRLIALAERAWHKANWEASASSPANETLQKEDWLEFASTLGLKELPRLAQDGIFYRIPPPGVQLNEEYLVVGCEFPGMLVRYREQQGPWYMVVCGDNIPASGKTKMEFQTSSRAAGTETRFSRSVYVDVAFGNSPTVFSVSRKLIMCTVLMLIGFI
ncbi:unnamed protein product [Clavelina lepadiformis]|uniref:beta-N-acetylhexosaminidase n=2 Tax=Clavelina lepadiformis TaxID=159417 RepID=A0ABP0GJY1_CLALP